MMCVSGAENEQFCEVDNEFTTYETCSASGNCHWGPHEVPACNPNWPHDSPFPVVSAVAKVAKLWSAVGR